MDNGQLFKLELARFKLHLVVIVCCLKTGAKNVSEIVEKTGLGQANVSKHLNMLTKAGIVAREQKGICVYYQIANPFIFELCDLVCDALSAQFQQQNQQLELIHLGNQSAKISSGKIPVNIQY